MERNVIFKVKCVEPIDFCKAGEVYEAEMVYIETKFFIWKDKKLHLRVYRNRAESDYCCVLPYSDFAKFEMV